MRMLGSILVVAIMAGPAFAQSEPDSLLTVEGSAVVRMAPDLAVVRLGVVRQASTAGEAQDSVNTVANGILNALLAAGVESTDVQTSRLDLSPVYSRGRGDPDQPPSIIAYRAANTIALRVGVLEQVGSLVDVALNAGANQLEGVSFQLQNDLEARKAALRDAVGEAREKAEVIADTLGVALVSIVSISEGGFRIDAPVMEARALSLQQGAPTPVSPGEVAVSASVMIRYRIEPN